MAVPALVIVGRERTATGTADDALLIEAEGLAEIAMRVD
jgi:ATP-dependent Lhr-like helicase